MRTVGIALFALIVAGGCASTPQTRLELRGDPNGPAVYELRETLWRQRPGGVEVVGYGVIPFYNSPIAIDYRPRWPTSGYVVFRLHGAPMADGRYAITLLGPARALGPGDDEMLTGVADRVRIEAPDDRTRRIELRDVPMRSRNRPGMRFVLSGVIVAEAADEAKFEKELRQFEEERSYRGPAASEPDAASPETPGR